MDHFKPHSIGFMEFFESSYFVLLILKPLNKNFFIVILNIDYIVINNVVKQVYLQIFV
jgi:hypothetical protein